jgi:tetratricopeptide (TPR) repeat protein
MKSWIAILFFSLISSTAWSLSKEEAELKFEQGNAAYEAGDFHNALKNYLEIGEDYNSFEYHFNLGNTYYKLDSVAMAILLYERAALINPADEDLIINLKITNQRVKDKIDALPALGVENLWDRLIASSMLSTWTYSTIFCWFTALGLIGLFFFTRSLVNRRFYAVSATILILGAALTMMLAVFTNNRLTESTEAIILSPKVDVMNQPNGSQTEFVLHEGTKVQMRGLSLDGTWIEIRIASGGIGWMKASDLREI